MTQPTGAQKKLQNPILRATLYPESGGTPEPDVRLDLAQVSGIGPHSQIPNCKSRILVGSQWYAIEDDFEELRNRWMTARKLPINL